MSGDPICFGCAHFRQYQPLEFMQPGECGWTVENPPAWLEAWLDSDDRYYGPKREVWGRGMHALKECRAFRPTPRLQPGGPDVSPCEIPPLTTWAGATAWIGMWAFFALCVWVWHLRHPVRATPTHPEHRP